MEKGATFPESGWKGEEQALVSRAGRSPCRRESGRPQRTYAEVIAANLVEIACSDGAGAVAAASQIADRIEGKLRQEVAVSDITEIQTKSDDELRFFLVHERWPEDGELTQMERQH